MSKGKNILKILLGLVILFILGYFIFTLGEMGI